MSRSRFLATACVAVLLPFAASAQAAGPKGTGLYPAAKDPTPPKTAEQARAELAAMRADGTLQRYQSLRNPPPVGVRNPGAVRKDLERPAPVAQDTRGIYVGG